MRARRDSDRKRAAEESIATRNEVAFEFELLRRDCAGQDKPANKTLQPVLNSTSPVRSERRVQLRQTAGFILTVNSAK